MSYLRRARRRCTDVRQAVRFAHQRLTRGWDERAYWDTQLWLSRNLGAVLTYTADRLHGYPEKIPFEEWQQQHREAGAALTAWANSGMDLDMTLDELAVLEANAKAALQWVGDNLSHLWD